MKNSFKLTRIVAHSWRSPVNAGGWPVAVALTCGGTRGRAREPAAWRLARHQGLWLFDWFTCVRDANLRALTGPSGVVKMASFGCGAVLATVSVRSGTATGRGGTGLLTKCFQNSGSLDSQGTSSLTRPKEFHSKESLSYLITFNGLHYYVCVCLLPESLYLRVRIKTLASVRSVRVS